MTYTDSNQIGEITETTGVAKIIRTDGTEVDATLGTAIYQGDIVETEGSGAVNIEFTDESLFAVSDNARITIDEFVFDPETEGGVQDFSVARGVFMYTSGLIGRENPDSVEIDTPVGAIGIRGTIIGGDIQPGGESQVTVIEGAIVVRNDAGERLLTNQFDTVNLTTRSAPPSAVKQMDVRDIADNFSAVKDVSSSLFSSFQDQMQQQETQQQEQPQQDQQLNNDNNETQEGDAEAQEQPSNRDGEGQGERVKAKSAKVQEEKSDKDVQENADETVEQNEDIIDRMEKMESMKKSAENAMETLEKSAMDDVMDMGMDGGMGDKAASNGDQMMRNKKSRQMMKEAQRNEDKEQEYEYEEIAEDVYVQQSGGDVLNYTPASPLFENANGSTTAIQLGQVSLASGASNVTYRLSGADASQFTIDASGNLFYIGANSGDYENGNSLKLSIHAKNLETGSTATKYKEIFVRDVNEKPHLQTDLADRYDVTGNIDAFVQSGSVHAGQKLTELNFHDPEGASFSDTDITLIGNLGTPSVNTFFEVVNDGGDLILQLKSGVSLEHVAGPNYKLTNGATDSGLLSGTDGHDIGIILNDNGASYSYTFKFAVGNAENVTGTSETDVSTFDNVFGDDVDNIFKLNDDNFKFISGGDGHDVLRLDGTNGTGATDSFDFSKTVSNLSGNSADLTSIEEIRFVDTLDELTLNIPDIIRLLKTSENNEFIIANGDSPNGTGGAEANNGIYFKDGQGNVESLTANGFSHAGTVTDNGETFQKFTHNGGLGDVLIEADINGAAAGGL